MTATPALRHVPSEASVVEVYGSKFLLEWLDWEVLASAAAHHLAVTGGTAQVSRPIPEPRRAPVVGQAA
jgi:hypothetical protein